MCQLAAPLTILLHNSDILSYMLLPIRPGWTTRKNVGQEAAKLPVRAMMGASIAEPRADNGRGKRSYGLMP